MNIMIDKNVYNIIQYFIGQDKMHNSVLFKEGNSSTIEG